MKTMNNEIRHASEVRAEGESRFIEGYALLFNHESRDLGGFVEEIRHGALDGVIERSDIVAVYQHNDDAGVLARSNKGKGTLALTVDNKGLKYRFEAPNTSVGDSVLEGLRRGDLSESSFRFTLDSDEWEERSDNIYKRYINKFDKLFDVSIVVRGAYSDTDVAARKLEEVRKANDKPSKEYYEQLRKI